MYLETGALIGRDNEYLKYALSLNLEITVAKDREYLRTWRGRYDEKMRQ